MSKEEITIKKQVTFYEIIKVGPKLEFFEDIHRAKALRATFGEYIKFLDGPSVESEDFVKDLVAMVDSLEDLIAIEVSTDIDDELIKTIIENSKGVPVVQPQFVSSVFVRYVSFTFPKLISGPVDLTGRRTT